MSQLILDDQLFDLEVLVPLARWITVERLRDLRPGEVVKDERVPMVLRLGKVARVGPTQIDYWLLGGDRPHSLSWPAGFWGTLTLCHMRTNMGAAIL